MIMVERCQQALISFASNSWTRNVEPVRIFRSASSLAFSHRPLVMNLLPQLSNYVEKTQHPDGGWADPEETAWACSLLEELQSSEDQRIRMPLRWLDSVRVKGGGWGRHPRDQVRIPTTALVIGLVPEIATQADWTWLRNEWSRDLERPVKLSYKGAFYLLAEPRDMETSVPDATISFLEGDQNEDGGFGPWKNHPIGSDPWSTGVVLWGLSRWIDKVDETVIERALAWLQRTQLPSGYWPYHYLDEGTSYALIGAASVLKALQRL